MFSYIGDFDRTLAALDELRRQMDRAFDDYHRAGPQARLGAGRYPAANLYDTGTAYLIKVELPGLAEKDINITLTQNVLAVSGERASDAPEGYSVHRCERTPVRFSRSFTLPSEVNSERVDASLTDGILTVRLEKSEEQKPRQISVRVS
jgi:HSP20 family protein